MIFTTQSMQEILPLLAKELECCKAGESIFFEVLDPDFADAYTGKHIDLDSARYIYRGYKAWVDLAELLFCKMMTPKKSTYPRITLRFKKLNTQHSFHLDTQSPKEEKYGVGSAFSQVNKMEEPAFLHYYTQALNNAKLTQRTAILNLGINTGDEFEVIKKSVDKEIFQQMSLTGIDHSISAIGYARERFVEDNVTLHAHDINALETLGLGRFDLLISIGTLQSPSINFKPFFMSLVQNYLQKDAAIILGFPNSRWIDGEMIYGAKAPNYTMSEMSLLFDDVIFCKKYLQQHKFRVTITGKQYLFLTATKIV